MSRGARLAAADRWTSPLHGAHLVVGFPGEQRAALLIEELRHVHPDLPVCVVDAHLDELPASVREIPGVHFVRGPLTQAETYRRAGIERAVSASVFPAGALESDDDAATVVQIGVMKRLVPSLRIVYLMADIRNEGLFEGLDASRVVYDMLFQAVVQEITDPGVSEAIESMLSNIKGANPKTVDAGLEGWTWGRLVGALHARNSTGDGAHRALCAAARGGRGRVARLRGDDPRGRPTDPRVLRGFRLGGGRPEVIGPLGLVSPRGPILPVSLSPPRSVLAPESCASEL